MDGCSRQDPAYRSAKGRAPRGALSIARGSTFLSTRPCWGLARAGLGDTAFQAACAAGHALSTDEAIALAGATFAGADGGGDGDAPT